MPPSIGFPGGTLDGAVEDKSQRLAFYRHLMERLDRVDQSTPPSSSALLAAPPPSALVVTGKDGYWTVSITNPQDIQPQTVIQLQQMGVPGVALGANPTNRRMQHRVQRSTELSFGTQALITEEPLTYDTTIVIQEPNQTKYFRLQSRFDGGDYNQWQLYQTPQVCGPFAVWSGLMSTSSSDLLFSPATTSDGSLALQQDGLTTNIKVLAKTWNIGTQQIAYSAGAVDPGSFDSWQIFAVDLKKAGGAVTYQATNNIGNLTAQNGITYFGNIKTTNAGAGTVRGGGQGGGGCAVSGSFILMSDGSEQAIETLRRGSRVRGIDGGVETLQYDPIPHTMPAFTFAAGTFFARGLSNTHLLLREGGIPAHAADLHPPYRVLVHEGQLAAISRRQYLGIRIVWELKLDGTKTYRVDGFWSHNKIFTVL